MSKAKTVSIPVPGGLVTHQGVVPAVVLREPTYDDFLELGEIYTYARSPEGLVLQVEDKDAVRAYIERLLVTPSDPQLMGQVGLAVAREVKGAVVSFFLNVSSEAAGSKTSQENSSGEQTSSPPTT